MSDSRRSPFLACVGFFGLLGLTTASAQPSNSPYWQGKFDLKVTARYESAEQTGLNAAHALTAGTDLGYTLSHGDILKASVQLENTVALDGDSYNQAGLNPGGAGQVVIADPEITELNQLWASAKFDAATAKVGRQIIIHDNARFVGNVGWRQNMQTFDAARFSLAAPDSGLAFDYAYVNQVLRIFGRDHAQGAWDSDSHLFNASWKARPDLTVTAYAYFLDFANSAANSCNTTGLAVTGKRPVSEDLNLVYRAEYATQTDYANNASDYAADYWCVEAGLATTDWSMTLGYEDLGADANVGFKTPLATAHAFNGWADLFLGTPATGLADIYLKATAKLPAELSATAVYHDFSASDGGTAFGAEIDLSLARPITQHVSALLKFANFNGAGPRPDVTKFWLQAAYTF